jgi:DNA processing protein
MGKKIYVLAHRIGESEATNRLLQEKKAEAIYDIDLFVKEFSGDLDSKKQQEQESPFLEFCKEAPSYSEALTRFPSDLFEAELSGTIEVKNGVIVLA